MRTTLMFTTTLGLLAAGSPASGRASERSGPGAAAGALAEDSSPCTAPLPSPALAVPPGNELEFQFSAVGVQIYACTATATGAAWVFTAPEANLYDRRGDLAGTHYAGPTWEASDGSKVVGARVAGATPDPASIPWLLLSAASHAGRGRMGEVTFVQRLRTAGGVAPAAGCDVGHVGAVARVPYTATYCFYEAD